MSIGRTFQESLQKAMRSLEIGSSGFESRFFEEPYEERRALTSAEMTTLESKLRIPNWERLWYLADAMRAGLKAAVDLGPDKGALRIGAGNYGGNLGPHHFHLKELAP